MINDVGKKTRTWLRERIICQALIVAWTALCGMLPFKPCLSEVPVNPSYGSFCGMLTYKFSDWHVI